LVSYHGGEALYEAKMVFFYGFWTYSGLFFKKMDVPGSIKSKRKIIPAIVLCAITVLWFVTGDLRFADMQGNKFPPNIVFLIYTTGALLTFYLFSKHIINGLNFLIRNKPFSWIYKQYIENCYSMFLYHPLAFLALYVFFRYSGLREYVFSNQWICMLIYMLITIPTTAIIGKFFSWAERISIKK
jgi:hypothetical protein